MRKIIVFITLLCFMFTGSGVPVVLGAQGNVLPAPGQIMQLSPEFRPAVLKGLKVYPNSPLRLDFIEDSGDHRELAGEEGALARKNESARLVQYFLAALTTPEKDLWVNLSPYEAERIIPEAFGQTAMGRDLLEQDNVLKQITASLLYPEGDTGKVFWQKVYAAAYAKYGTTDMPFDTFNKVWIVPQYAKVYEHGDTAFIVNAKLKLMLEKDYLATSTNAMPTLGHDAPPADTNERGFVSQSRLPTPQPTNVKATQVSTPTPNHPSAPSTPNQQNDIARDVLREVVIPVLEHEVNEGANFAPLRQVYASLILALWYKQRMRHDLLGREYADRNKVSGIEIGEKDAKSRVYQSYLQAFRQGVYNYIKEEADPGTGEIIPRKYFSGGFLVPTGFNIDLDASAAGNDMRVKAGQLLVVDLGTDNGPGVEEQPARAARSLRPWGLIRRVRSGKETAEQRDNAAFSEEALTHPLAKEIYGKIKEAVGGLAQDALVKGPLADLQELFQSMTDNEWRLLAGVPDYFREHLYSSDSVPQDVSADGVALDLRTLLEAMGTAFDRLTTLENSGVFSGEIQAFFDRNVALDVYVRAEDLEQEVMHAGRRILGMYVKGKINLAEAELLLQEWTNKLYRNRQQLGAVLQALDLPGTSVTKEIRQLTVRVLGFADEKQIIIAPSVSGLAWFLWSGLDIDHKHQGSAFSLMDEQGRSVPVAVVAGDQRPFHLARVIIHEASHMESDKREEMNTEFERVLNEGFQAYREYAIWKKVMEAAGEDLRVNMLEMINAEYKVKTAGQSGYPIVRIALSKLAVLLQNTSYVWENRIVRQLLTFIIQKPQISLEGGADNPELKAVFLKRDFGRLRAALGPNRFEVISSIVNRWAPAVSSNGGIRSFVMSEWVLSSALLVPGEDVSEEIAAKISKVRMVLGEEFNSPKVPFKGPYVVDKVKWPADLVKEFVAVTSRYLTDEITLDQCRALFVQIRDRSQAADPSAVAGQPGALDSAADMRLEKGGIDFSAERTRLDVSSDPAGSGRLFNPEALPEVGIDRLYIKSINVRPLVNLPQMLGLPG
ncbi:MAG: hypothetical protein HQL20_04170 [Candidatus Omnitrophica bacterium]|nr:hypothetical protein [Candidatus Omnitrophota bacterium]